MESGQGISILWCGCWQRPGEGTEPWLELQVVLSPCSECWSLNSHPRGKQPLCSATYPLQPPPPMRVLTVFVCLFKMGFLPSVGIKGVCAPPSLPSFYPMPSVHPTDPLPAVPRYYLTLGTHQSPAWLGPPMGGGCSQPHL